MIARREFLSLSGATALAGALGAPLRAETDAVALTWSDLVPGGAQARGFDRLFDIIQHGEIVAFGGEDLVEDYNGRRVSLPGYMVPLEFRADGVRDFLLVPFIGACIHVPPPPPNQIVLVTAETPYPSNDYFDAVTVTGVFDHFGVSLELAEVGYIITADQIVEYAY